MLLANQELEFNAVLEIYDRGEIFRPWQSNPYRAVSWWEMLQFSARGFYWLSQYLEHLKLETYLSAIPVDGDAAIFDMTAPLDENVRNKALKMLSHVETSCREVGINISADTTAELVKEINRKLAIQNCQWLSDRTIALQKLVEKELKSKVFLYCPPEQAQFFPTNDKPHPFGASVADAFPSASYDIQEAAACLAMARSSASVFHLMRTLEFGLSALGVTFEVSLEHTNWAPALDQIESKIRGMHKDQTWKAIPTCKDLQEQYSQAASTFGVLKDAWRNYTMHKRGKYTESEAVLLFNNVKAFMQKIADLGLKETA